MKAQRIAILHAFYSIHYTRGSGNELLGKDNFNNYNDDF